MWRAVARRAAREAFARSDGVAAREIDVARATSALTRGGHGVRCVCGCASPTPAASTSREESSSSSVAPTKTRLFHNAPVAFRSRSEWARLVHEGHDVNPCNSPKHPAALAGIPIVDGKPMLSIQASYDEHSQCFVCGNAHESGLGLKSFRVEENDPRWADASPSALRSVVTVTEAYQGLPGIVSTGVMDSLMICHGSWQAAIALMDRAVLPRPPLVMPRSYSMQIHDRLPPGTEIEVTTKAIEVRDDKAPNRVRVMMELKAAGDDDHDGKGFVCASSEAMYEKVGAVRSMW
mgnify:FL=1